MKNIEEFYEEVIKSKDLQNEFASCKNDDDLKIFLSSHNCDAKVVDVMNFLKEKFQKDGKVNNEELEKISGGRIIDWKKLIPPFIKY